MLNRRIGLLVFIGMFFFAGARADKVILPGDLTTVGESAFERDVSITEVVVPFGAESIQARAFAYSGLQTISIPETVQEIAADAFEGIAALTMIAPEESAAYLYAQNDPRITWQEPVEEDPVPASGSMVLGRYPQSADGTEAPITWRVIAKRSGAVMLISEYGLDSRRYHGTAGSVTWADSDLRSWLNGEFYSSAFTAEEKSRIIQTRISNAAGECDPEFPAAGGADTYDKVFLLSFREARQYMDAKKATETVFESKTAAAKPTAYALKQGAYTVNLPASQYKWAGYAAWWLRSPGYYQHDAEAVRDNGSLTSEGVSTTGKMVRPVIWVRDDE